MSSRVSDQLKAMSVKYQKVDLGTLEARWP